MPGDASSTTFHLGGDLKIHRLSFGTIHLTVQRAFGSCVPPPAISSRRRSISE